MDGRKSTKLNTASITSACMFAIIIRSRTMQGPHCLEVSQATILKSHKPEPTNPT